MGACKSKKFNKNKYLFHDEVDAAKKREACKEIWSQVVDEEEYLSLKFADNEIENLVFEGGGCKGIGYCGAIKALDDLGILKKVKRFAGTSAGSYVAMRLALGTPIDDVLLNSMENIQEAIYDSGTFGFIINILNKFGWHTGKNLLAYIREDVKEATGDPDFTFYQLYKKTGRELCIVVTNVSTAQVEYCHPKTTPNMSIAQAVRTSMSIPIIFQPYTWSPAHGEAPQYFCDGGLVDNYPICAFDGWYLSMKKEDSFFHKIGETTAPFAGSLNKKTLGMVLFNAMECEHYEEVYLRRYGDKAQGTRPKTKLAKNRAKELDILLEKKKTRGELIEASQMLLAKLAENDLDRSGDISLNEFKATMTKMIDDPVMKKHLKSIFGEEELDLDELFRLADSNEDNLLSFTECLHMLQTKGVPLRQLIQNSVPGDINGMVDYLQSIVAALDYRVRSLTSRPEDVQRTVGIYTDYIGTTDFEMDVEDKIYGIRQGWVAAIAYFKEKASGKSVKPKPALAHTVSLHEVISPQRPVCDDPQRPKTIGTTPTVDAH